MLNNEFKFNQTTFEAAMARFLFYKSNRQESKAPSIVKIPSQMQLALKTYRE